MLVLIHRDRSRSRRPARAGEDRRRSRAAIAGAAVLAAAALLTVSAPAARAAVPVHGYVWADQPSTPGCYTPNELYQANSTGALNAICHAAGQPGVYTVSFPGLGAAGGIVNVTAYAGWRRGDHVPAQLRRTCMVERWYPVQHWNPVQSSEDAIVRCFDGHTPADARFAATFSQPPTPWTGPGDFAYVYANQPATATYTPMLATQYNSRGGVNTITHDGSGDYVVRLPGLGPLAEGTVKVTYAQSGNGTCNVVRWRPEGHDQLVHVRCFTATGAPTDAFFTLTYADHVSVLGDPGLRYGYVWANQPTRRLYHPDRSYQQNSNHTIDTIHRWGRGHYTVRLPGLGETGGHAHVTAYGNADAPPKRCKVADWVQRGSDELIEVFCSSPSGTPADSQLTLQYTE